MVKLQKYLFDTDFGTPRIAQVDMGYDMDEPEDNLAVEPPPPPPPTFSEEELTLAREQAFEAGRQAGLEEAATALEQMVGMAMATCTHYLHGLGEAQKQANETLSRDAVTIGLLVLRKLHPEFCRRYGSAEIEAVLSEAMGQLDQVAKITVKVHPDLVEAVRDKCKTMAHDAGFDGKLVIKDDVTMTLGDCRVEWGEGGLERDSARNWADIDQAVQAALGTLPEMGA